MHARTLLLTATTMATLQLAYGELHAGMARITQGPSLAAAMYRRDTCPDGPYTECSDGFGCCEVGAPCTTLHGLPACDAPCDGGPCGAGLCCDATCSTSLGNPICVHETSDPFTYSDLTTDVTIKTTDVTFKTTDVTLWTPDVTISSIDLTTVTPPEFTYSTEESTYTYDESTSSKENTDTNPETIPTNPYLASTPTASSTTTTPVVSLPTETPTGSGSDSGVNTGLAQGLSVDVKAWALLAMGAFGGIVVLL